MTVLYERRKEGEKGKKEVIPDILLLSVVDYYKSTCLTSFISVLFLSFLFFSLDVKRKLS